MKAYLLRLKTMGLKNLEHEVCLNFADETIPERIEPKNQNVKAIYGLNGAGKTALIASVDLAKKIITEKGYIPRMQKAYFDQLFNKKSPKFVFRADFAIYDETKDNEVIDVFSYDLEVDPSSTLSSNGYGIKSESLALAKGRTLNEQTKPVFSVKKGILSFSEADDPLNQELRAKTMNLLVDSSLSSLFVSLVQASAFPYEDATKKSSELFVGCLALFVFGASLTVFLENEDQHQSYRSDALAILQKMKMMKAENFQSLFLSALSQSPLSSGEQVIEKKALPDFEKAIGQLTAFVKMFKPELKRIDLDKKIDGSLYHIRKIFVYPDYTVDSEFESAGIKKMMALFSYFKQVNDGQIVFIDEMDASLHDVYLCKLLDYFSEFAKGQLCFTTHNIGPMSHLADKKHSLDFLGNENYLASWVKNAHYQPYIQYPDGMIKGSPFNFESFDFLPIFNEGKPCN
jgi:AAA15 family ATPase/GTPase